MKISFDIDDTLIFYDKSKNNKSDSKLLSGEVLRSGSLGLLKALQEDHELWIYTTSYRSPFFLKLFFRFKGIKIARVINQRVHEQLLRDLKLSSKPTKLPNHFGIDLHIDDSEGVALEGQKFGFNTLVIDPADKCWDQKIMNNINEFSDKI